jgi:hypothetical protein
VCAGDSMSAVRFQHKKLNFNVCFIYIYIYIYIYNIVVYLNIDIKLTSKTTNILKWRSIVVLWIET